MHSIECAGNLQMAQSTNCTVQSMDLHVLGNNVWHGLYCAVAFVYRPVLDGKTQKNNYIAVSTFYNILQMLRLKRRQSEEFIIVTNLELVLS